MNNKILVADDEKEIRDLLEIYLLNEGYKVVKAKDGQEALDIIENEDVDLLVLDIMMPKVNGIE
ncbi:response regulator, partial [Intestinibacter bartlettii]